jgi:hypothetical protein
VKRTGIALGPATFGATVASALFHTTGPAGSMSGMRLSRVRNIAFSSRRARCDPTQKCVPNPKARWALGERVTLNDHGSGN